MRRIVSGVDTVSVEHEPFGAVGYTRDFYWLLDGSMAPTGKEGKVVEYVKLLDKKLRENVRYVDTPKELLREAIAAVDKEYKGRKKGRGRQPAWEPSASAVIAKVDKEKVEYAVLGTCSFRLEIANRCVEETCSELSEIVRKEKSALTQLVHSGVSDNSIAMQRARDAMIAEENKWRNKMDGFWIAATEPKAVEFALIGEELVKEKEFIITLASSGMDRLTGTFGGPNKIGSLGNALLEQGGDKLLEELRKFEKLDTKADLTSKYSEASFLVVKFDQEEI